MPLPHLLIAVIILTSCLFSHPSRATKSDPGLQVVTSIRPLHAIASHIMQGVGEPQLLLSQNQSPHHYSLRPSERRLLANADIIFWVGEELESFLPRVLNSLDKQATVVRLMDTDGLIKLELRQKHSDHKQHDFDPHIWLSLHNARIIAQHMAEVLIKQNPEHKTRYQQNLDNFLQEILQLHNHLLKQFTGKRLNYLVYHDAFQYFEHTYHLQPLATISYDEEQAPGAKHLRYIRQLIESTPVDCIFYTPPFEHAVVKTLAEDFHLKTIAVDPLGTALTPGAGLYTQLIRDMSQAISRCVADPS